MRVYEAIVRGLEDLGVRTAFGGNGENIAGLTVALARSRRIRPILTRHELGAAYMAGGYAMFTRELGVCFATVGPGAFNLVTGLAVAMSDSYPVLALTGYVDERFAGRGGINDTSGIGDTPDSQALFAATTKRSYVVQRPEEAIDVLEEAVDVALSGRPGPVHVAVAQQLAHPAVEVPDYRAPVLSARPPQPAPGDVAAMADRLAAAIGAGRSVLVLAGFGAVRSHAHDTVRRFVERFQLPLVTTLDGKGIIPERHPLCRGVFSESGHAHALRAFRDADVVLAIGNSLNQHATFGLREDLFEDKELLQVNISAADIGRQYPATVGMVADADPAVAALTDALSQRLPAPPPPAPADPGPDRDVGPLAGLTRHVHPGRLAEAMGRLLPPGGVILADAGAHLAWLGYHLALEDGQAFHKCGAFGPMAANTTAAIGIKAAQPGRAVVVGCGDGCFAMSGLELMTAVENELPVVWVIFDDAELKLIRLYQLATYGHTGLVDLAPPDFAAVARACGADGYRVETIEEFEKAYAAALASPRPSVIDARITRWALPHYTSSPKGPLHGAWEMLVDRFSPPGG
ncbi:thiamine pyrophosphate-binding protein [Nocardioides sp. YIM 152588]|uniref:thiamine pyrophosphate-binding protein n=1 Tax=Nocardioides sp. YIM 152588 TaxID=3158259 RepID=UPI0032E4C851